MKTSSAAAMTSVFLAPGCSWMVPLLRAATLTRRNLFGWADERRRRADGVRPAADADDMRRALGLMLVWSRPPLMALKARGAAAGYEAIDDYYTDTSHFLRDSERFLGMTARRFLQLEMPFLDQYT